MVLFPIRVQCRNYSRLGGGLTVRADGTASFPGGYIRRAKPAAAPPDQSVVKKRRKAMRHQVRWTIAILACLATVSVACGGNGDTTSGAATASPATCVQADTCWELVAP